MLSDVAAGARDGSATGDLQTFGGTRVLARYVKIEGTVSIGGSLDITEVFMRTLLPRDFMSTSMAKHTEETKKEATT